MSFVIIYVQESIEIISEWARDEDRKDMTFAIDLDAFTAEVCRKRHPLFDEYKLQNLIWFLVVSHLITG